MPGRLQIALDRTSPTVYTSPHARIAARVDGQAKENRDECRSVDNPLGGHRPRRTHHRRRWTRVADVAATSPTDVSPFRSDWRSVQSVGSGVRPGRPEVPQGPRSARPPEMPVEPTAWCRRDPGALRLRRNSAAPDSQSPSVGSDDHSASLARELSTKSRASGRDPGALRRARRTRLRRLGARGRGHLPISRACRPPAPASPARR